MKKALIIAAAAIAAVSVAGPATAGTDTAFAPDVYPIQLQWRHFAHKCVQGHESACRKADVAAAKMRAKDCEMLTAKGVRLDENSWLCK